MCYKRDASYCWAYKEGELDWASFPPFYPQLPRLRTTCACLDVPNSGAATESVISSGAGIQIFLSQ